MLDLQVTSMRLPRHAAAAAAAAAAAGDPPEGIWQAASPLLPDTREQQFCCREPGFC
jgi:hypothetical protein